MEASTASVTIARHTWELENNIVMETPSSAKPSPSASVNPDAMYLYDEAAKASIQQQKPWTRDPQFFKNVKISALALLKMVVHARSGGRIEVMGLMQGKTEGDTIKEAIMICTIVTWLSRLKTRKTVEEGELHLKVGSLVVWANIAFGPSSSDNVLGVWTLD